MMNQFKKSLRSGACLTALSLALLCGCSKLSPENFEKVKTGMTTAEVKAILGNPSEVKTGDLLGVGTTTYIYKSGKKSAELSFINDAVMTKSGNF